MSGYVALDPGVVVTNQQFFDQFPAFQEAAYSDIALSTYLNLAFTMLPPDRWGAMKPLGSMWWAAHFMTLDAQDEANANAGRAGAFTNPMASKSVGSVSVSYDTTSGTELNAGHWNLTPFGRRFIRFARLAGMGPIQIGGTIGPTGDLLPRVAYLGGGTGSL